MDDARERLRFHLEMQDGFWFALVAADDRSWREALRSAAEGWAEELGIAFRAHALRPELAVELRDAPGGVHWVTAGADPSGEEAAARFLMALNERREAFRRHFPGGLVVEGPTRLKVLLRNLAPDLFSVRAAVLEPAGTRGVEVETPWWLGPDAVADRSQVRQWGQPALPWHRWETTPEGASEEARGALAEARRLEGRVEEGARRSRLAAMGRAVAALLAQGWISEAAPIAEEMLALAAELEDATWVRSSLAEAREANAEIAVGQGDLVAAREHWQEALSLRASLAGDPLDAATAARTADVARCHSQLGELALMEGRPERARDGLHRALELRNELVSAFPTHADWKADLALTHSLLGDVHMDLGETAEAARAYAAALDLRRELAEADADPRRQAALSVAWGRTAIALAARGDRAGAHEAAGDALRIARAVAGLDEGNVNLQSQLATALSRYGDTLEEPRDAYREALAIRRRLCEDDPDNARWQHWLAVVHGRLAERCGLAEHAAEALAIAEHLAWQDPTNATWQLGLADARRVAALAAPDEEERRRLAGLALDALAHAESLGATRGGAAVRALARDLGLEA